LSDLGWIVRLSLKQTVDRVAPVTADVERGQLPLGSGLTPQPHLLSLADEFTILKTIGSSFADKEAPEFVFELWTPCP
jgi:hypothetical protein